MPASFENIYSVPCDPHHFSSDAWDAQAVATLRDRLLAQQVSREQATGVVVGAGSLPYTLGYLGVSRVDIIDSSLEVVQGVQSRIALLGRVASWGAYRAGMEAALSPGLTEAFNGERATAVRSGLLIDFAATQAGAASTDIVPHHGDIIRELPRLAEQLKQEDRTVSIVNVTNVGQYLERTDEKPFVDGGRAALASLVRQLPLLDTAIIIESYLAGPKVRVRTAEQYFARFRRDQAGW